MFFKMMSYFALCIKNTIILLVLDLEKKINKQTKTNWTCKNFKVNKGAVTPEKNNSTNIKPSKLEKNAIISDKTLNAVVESVNFMRQFTSSV